MNDSFYRDLFLERWRAMSPLQQEEFVLALLNIFSLSLDFVDRLSIEVDAEMQKRHKAQ